MILPVIGKYIPSWERRCAASDYASVVIELMQNPTLWEDASKASRKLAEELTWEKVVDEWEAMLVTITQKERVGATRA